MCSLVGISLAIAIFLQWNATYAFTNTVDKSILSDFYYDIENKEALASWKGEDPCGNWKYIECRGGFVIGISMQSLGLRGKLPGNLNQMKQLTTISVQENSFEGTLPSFSGLANLQVAYLNDNNFNFIPYDFFSGLTNLQGLYLDNNPLNESTGWSLPSDILGSQQLMNLSLTNTTLTGQIPEFIGNLSSLQNIRLAYNYLRGPLPSSLSATVLKTLVANNQQGDLQLTGNLDVLGSMTSLTQVWLHYNDFSGEIPEDLRNAAGLVQLLLNNNRLTGFVPASFASLRNLKNFSVDYNLLDGPVPVMGKTMHFTYGGNYFCSSNAGVECSEEAYALLRFLKGVRYPPNVVRSWAGNDPCAGWYGVTCGSNRKVSVVNLAKRGLSGRVNPSIGNLSALTELILNDNRLTGTIPESLTQLKALRLLNLSNNNLNGPVPSFGPGVVLNTQGNPLINTTIAPAPSPPESESSLSPIGSGSAQIAGVPAKKKPSSRVVDGIILTCVILVIVLFGLFCLVRGKSRKFLRLSSQRRFSRQGSINRDGFSEAGSSSMGSDSNVMFPLSILRKATHNFSPENLLGRGGFGSVYEGKLENGLKVAVKRMDPQLVSNKGLQEFHAEINMLGKIRHRNLVALLGYCTQNNERMLVYEYMPRGTLSLYLFSWQQNGLKPLDLNTRLLIALDVAHGMQYLHNMAYKIIIHRDLKPSNILLDEDLRAKVSDFGLARLAPEDKVSLETRLAGTFGYLAPEYAATGRVNTRSDVYSFGVVLMELITGQKALDEKRAENKIHLVPWFRHFSRDQEKIKAIIDPVLQVTDENLQNINSVAQLAWHCTQREPSARPDMDYAVAVIGPLVRQWRPSSAESDDDFMDLGITAEQAIRQWKVFDDLSISASGTDAGSSQQTDFGNPRSVSAR